MWKEFHPVKRIEFYSGVKLNESPRRIYTDNEEIIARRILEIKEIRNEKGDEEREFIFEDSIGRMFKIHKKGDIWQMFLWS